MRSWSFSCITSPRRPTVKSASLTGPALYGAFLLVCCGVHPRERAASLSLRPPVLLRATSRSASRHVAGERHAQLHQHPSSSQPALTLQSLRCCRCHSRCRPRIARPPLPPPQYPPYRFHSPQRPPAGRYPSAVEHPGRTRQCLTSLQAPGPSTHPSEPFGACARQLHSHTHP